LRSAGYATHAVDYQSLTLRKTPSPALTMECGDDLEKGPFEIEEIGLEAALAEIASISA
jgi:hypothetical protein